MDVAGPGREQESDARPQNYLCGGNKREKKIKKSHISGAGAVPGSRPKHQAASDRALVAACGKAQVILPSPTSFWQGNHHQGHVFPTPAAPPVCHSGVPSRATKPHGHIHTALPSAAGEEKEKASVEDKPWRDPTAENVGN